MAMPIRDGAWHLKRERKGWFRRVLLANSPLLQAHIAHAALLVVEPEKDTGYVLPAIERLRLLAWVQREREARGGGTDNGAL